MNPVNNLVKFILSTALAVCLSGCTENIEPEISYDEVKVSLRLDQTFQEKAYVRLNHDGAAEDYWYYVVTQDMETEAEAILKASLQFILETEGEIVANVGTNRNITLDGLEPKTSYKVVASRILPDGTPTGNVAELVFTTLRDPDVFESHPSWNISYKERRVSEDDPDTETEVFECAVGGSEDTYVPCLLSKDDFTRAYGGNLRACFEDYVAFRNLENVKWPNVIKSEPCEYTEDRLRHGEYILFMIGIDDEGGLTGYYSRTDCTIVQEEATDAYRRWVGRWTLSGRCGDQTISYPVEIAPDENNLYYRMYGWESTSADEYFKTLPEQLPLLLYFEKSTGFAYVVSEELADLPDETLAEFYDFYLYGCVEIEYNGAMTEVPVDVANLRIARFSLTDDNHASVLPEVFSFDLNGVHYDAPFLYFNYSYISMMYNALAPVTADSFVPRISTMTLER